MSDWKAAFERDKHKVGRAVHEAWAAEKVRQGFADHAFQHHYGACGVKDQRGTLCSISYVKHHTDMLDFDDLAPHIQEYDIQTGIVGFRMGYEAAQQDGERGPISHDDRLEAV